MTAAYRSALFWDVLLGQAHWRRLIFALATLACALSFALVTTTLWTASHDDVSEAQSKTETEDSPAPDHDELETEDEAGDEHEPSLVREAGYVVYVPFRREHHARVSTRRPPNPSIDLEPRPPCSI